MEVLQCRSKQSLAPANTFTLEGCSKTGAYGYWSNHICRGQGVQYYKSYEGGLFFSKSAKCCVDSKNAVKNWENIFRFWDNSVWTWCLNFSHLWREYMWPSINGLPNRRKISDLTKTDVFLVNSSYINGKLEENYCSAGSNSVSGTWTSLLSKGVLK